MNQNNRDVIFYDAPETDTTEEEQAFLNAIQNKEKRAEVISILMRAELIPW